MTHALDLVPEGGWRGPAAPRIAPANGRLQAMVGTGTRMLGRVEPANVFLLLQRAPRLFFPWLAFAGQLMPFGSIPALDRERMILRVAWNCRSRYEWGQHLDIAARLGLPDEDARHVAAGPSSPRWSTHERALLTACDEIHRERFVSDATFETLRCTLDEPQLVELLLLVGHYEMLASVLNSAGVTLEPSIEARIRSRAMR